MTVHQFFCILHWLLYIIFCIFEEANDERDGRLEQVTHRLEEAEGRYQSHQARLSSMEGEIHTQFFYECAYKK